MCSDPFVDLSPHKVFTALIDEGTEVCSVRSVFRLLEVHALSGGRYCGGHRSPWRYPVLVLVATRQTEAWSWDIEPHEAP